jgi:hypothetical protein
LACHLPIDVDPDPAYHFDADPDPACHVDADADENPDPTFQFDADPHPNPQHCITVLYKILKFLTPLTLARRSNDVNWQSVLRIRDI